MPLNCHICIGIRQLWFANTTKKKKKDNEERGNFVHWYLRAVHNAQTDPTVILFATKLSSRSVDTSSLGITVISPQTLL